MIMYWNKLEIKNNGGNFKLRSFGLSIYKFLVQILIIIIIIKRSIELLEEWEKDR